MRQKCANIVIGTNSLPLPVQTANIQMNLSEFEIMAPAGSYDSLMAAIQGGADSIYFGIEGLNMRAKSSNNFTISDLHEIARICKENGLKSYLTVNTVIYDEDLQLMRDELRDVVHEAERDDAIGAVVITGAGRAFSSGGDQKRDEVALPRRPAAVVVLANGLLEEGVERRVHPLGARG